MPFTAVLDLVLPSSKGTLRPPIWAPHALQGFHGCRPCVLRAGISLLFCKWTNHHVARAELACPAGLSPTLPEPERERKRKVCTKPSDINIIP